MDDVTLLESLAPMRERLLASIGKVVVGQHEVVDLMLTALFSDGHCLFVGVPGLAKTLLVRTVAEAVGVSFGRVQFTPDLMPSDITGVEVMEEDRAQEAVLSIDLNVVEPGVKVSQALPVFDGVCLNIKNEPLHLLFVVSMSEILIKTPREVLLSPPVRSLSVPLSVSTISLRRWVVRRMKVSSTTKHQ